MILIGSAFPIDLFLESGKNTKGWNEKILKNRCVKDFFKIGFLVECFEDFANTKNIRKKFPKPQNCSDFIVLLKQRNQGKSPKNQEK